MTIHSIEYQYHDHFIDKSIVIQGGDWGSIIARVMATLYPQHVKAVHLNFAPVAPPYPWRHPWIFLQSILTLPFSPKSRALISTTLDYMNRGNGYLRQQETRPQTLGYGLHDSPVALLAWIYDKLHAWADDYPWTDDEILTWVSVYQFSVAGPAASVRIYYEAAQTPPADATASALKRVSTVDAISGSIPGEVKLAVAHFKRELIKLPFLWCRSMGSVVRESEFECGGHFAAWEVPELLAADVRSFLGKRGQAYAAVTGKNGY
jgi:microsomal epoxide hydrolase